MTATIPGTHLWPADPPDLSTVLLTGPDLRGAACAGPHAHLWDDALDGYQRRRENDTNRAERHQSAIDTCRECPVLEQCLQARFDDPTLGAGVYGGRLFGPDNRRACRCGNPIDAGANPTRKHCSDPCRTRANHHRATERHVTCLCGTVFTTHQPRQRLCSDPCRAEDRRRSQRVAA